MSDSVFVDTLFVIALINRRDQYHKRALALADTYDGAALLTTDAVLLEVENALARHFKKEAVEIIFDFLAADDVSIIHLDAVYSNRPSSYLPGMKTKHRGWSIASPSS